MSYSIINEICLYVVVTLVGWLLAVVFVKIGSENSVDYFDKNANMDSHNEEPVVDDEEIKKVQDELKGTFRGFELCIVVLVICIAIAVYFALTV